MNGDLPVRVEQRGAVAVWTIDRADRMNALSRSTLLALGRLAHEASTNASVRAVIITGAGDKAFSAGADLKERQTMTENEVRAQIDLYRTELRPIDLSTKPIVAAVNGFALGGGLELALACDLRVAAAGATFGLPETSLGIIPGAGGTQRLARLIGAGRAKEMILLGRRIGAEEALAWGLVNRVTPTGQDVVEDAVEWLRPVAEGAPIAQAAALEAIDGGLDVSLDVGLVLEKVGYEKTIVTEDRREGLAARVAKRTARFQGR
ncbi:MAG: enoyl-CoA hydratase-related protein [Polyangiaceae bacterium]